MRQHDQAQVRAIATGLRRSDDPTTRVYADALDAIAARYDGGGVQTQIDEPAAAPAAGGPDGYRFGDPAGDLDADAGNGGFGLDAGFGADDLEEDGLHDEPFVPPALRIELLRHDGNDITCDQVAEMVTQTASAYGLDDAAEYDSTIDGMMATAILTLDEAGFDTIVANLGGDLLCRATKMVDGVRIDIAANVGDADDDSNLWDENLIRRPAAEVEPDGFGFGWGDEDDEPQYDERHRVALTVSRTDGTPLGDDQVRDHIVAASRTSLHPMLGVLRYAGHRRALNQGRHQTEITFEVVRPGPVHPSHLDHGTVRSAPLDIDGVGRVQVDRLAAV